MQLTELNEFRPLRPFEKPLHQIRHSSRFIDWLMELRPDYAYAGDRKTLCRLLFSRYGTGLLFVHSCKLMPVIIRSSSGGNYSVILVVTAALFMLLILAPFGDAEAKPQTGGTTEDAEESRDPLPRSLELNEAGVKAVERRDWSRAEESFREAISADSGNLTAVFNLAGVYITQKKTAPAIALLTEYTAKVPTDAGLLVRLGDAYFSSKSVAKAQSAYERAFKLAPDYAGLPQKLGTIYSLSKNFHMAEEMYEKAVSQTPDDVPLLNSLSNIYTLNGKADKGVATAKIGLQVKADRNLYVSLGTAYEAQRDFKNSLIAFEKAIDLGDTSNELKQKVESLRKIAS